MSYKGINWYLRRRACEHFGHKSAYPCVRCGVRGEGPVFDLAACADEYVLPAILDYIFKPSPMLAYLRRAR